MAVIMSNATKKYNYREVALPVLLEERQEFSMIGRFRNRLTPTPAPSTPPTPRIRGYMLLIHPSQASGNVNQ